jgi:serine/threonine protein kinase
MIGHVLIDRYEIRKQLGKKAGRQTLLAWDHQSKNLVVVKLVSFSQDFVWDDLKLFEREAETLRTLSHAKIPQYLDFFEVALPHAQSFALVQTYVEGDCLEAYLKAGQTFSEPEVKQIANSLLDILVYLHGRHPAVIHRDIKPSNILLKSRAENALGDIYLVDFGSVQTLAAREGGTITIVGTYGYMPPEQFGGRASPASDLYGLGATLIYIATGRHPADIPQKQLRLQFQPLTNLSVEFTRWIARLVEPGLDERFNSAEAALHQLNHLSYRQPLFEPAAPLVPVEITKPKDSPVELVVSDHSLTIQFPPMAPQRKRPELSFLTGVSIYFWLPMAFGLAAIDPGLAMFLFLLWCIGAYWEPIKLRVFRRFSKFSRLVIDQEQVHLQLYEAGKLKTSSSPRQTIRSLEFRSNNEGYYSFVIRARQQHEFGSNQALSSRELQWLAQEVGQWLEMPVQQIQQHLPLPNALFRRGTPQIISFPGPVEKPIGSKVVLMKQPSWIDILVPLDANPNPDRYTRLRIDNQEIQLTSTLEKVPRPSHRMIISAIEYHGDQESPDGLLRVWAGNRPYGLGENRSLSPNELKWLAYELSQWLRLPVYQTRK